MDCSLPGFSVHGILQARILEWVAISFSRESSQPGYRACISCVSCIDRQIPYHQSHLVSHIMSIWNTLKDKTPSLPLLSSCYIKCHGFLSVWRIVHDSSCDIRRRRWGKPCLGVSAPRDVTSVSVSSWWQTQRAGFTSRLLLSDFLGPQTPLETVWFSPSRHLCGSHHRKASPSHSLSLFVVRGAQHRGAPGGSQWVELSSLCTAGLPEWRHSPNEKRVFSGWSQRGFRLIC